MIKVHEIRIPGYAQFLQTFGDELIVIDRGGYAIYSEMELIEQVAILDLPAVYQIFTSFSSKKIMLDCLEDNILIVIDIASRTFKKIHTKFNHPLILSPLYQWDEDKALFLTAEGDTICVDMQTFSVDCLNKETIKTRFPLFAQFVQMAQNFNVQYYMPGPNQILYETDEGNVGFFDFITKQSHEIKPPECIDHYINYYSGWFVFVREHTITLINQQQKHWEMHSEKNREFLCGRFFSDGKKIIILSGDIRNKPDTRLSIYCLPTH
jgi:hypothetical protein